jgi:hypothetical protein
MQHSLSALMNERVSTLQRLRHGGHKRHDFPMPVVEVASSKQQAALTLAGQPGPGETLAILVGSVSCSSQPQPVAYRDIEHDRQHEHSLDVTTSRLLPQSRCAKANANMNAMEKKQSVFDQRFRYR